MDMHHVENEWINWFIKWIVNGLVKMKNGL